MAVSSRPFQSQTFSRLMAGRNRLSSWGQKRLAQLRGLASYSLQVVLYPIYVGFQTTRLLYRQLGIASIRRSGNRQLSCDAPILKLTVALRGGVPQLSSWGLGPRLPLSIAKRARVACDLSSQSLDLLDQQGQPIAITPDQRAQLQQLMYWLLADWAYQQYQFQRQRRLQGQPLPLPSASPQAWLPVRWFYHLMGWMQLAPVAVTANLFQEAWWIQAPIDPLLITAPQEPLPVSERRLGYQGYLDTQLTSPLSLIPPEDPGALTVAPGHDPMSIDTEAVLVSYVDHPLTLMLRWLDWGLLWIERKLLQLWRWLRR